MEEDEKFMHRCLKLAALGANGVAPNPLVGAVLVHNGKIIGEGYHQKYGEAHAEVNCIANVLDSNKHLIPLSTLYVSLEPCAHYGKTPPCTDLIIQHSIKNVVVGCRDSFEKVDGKGIQKLQEAGISVKTGVLENECFTINKRFFTFHLCKRPFITLKWASTSNQIIGNTGEKRLLITNSFTNRWVHKIRSEEHAILIGQNTAVKDNPRLDNRLWYGKSPIRLIIDRKLSLPANLHIFNGFQKTILFNVEMEKQWDRMYLYKLIDTPNLLPQIISACNSLGIHSILVEGGRSLLQSFIDNGLWDEAITITNTAYQQKGVAAPILNEAQPYHYENINGDIIVRFYCNPN